MYYRNLTAEKQPGWRPASDIIVVQVTTLLYTRHGKEIVLVYFLTTADINEAEKDSDGCMMINAGTKAYLLTLCINNGNIFDPVSAIKI